MSEEENDCSTCESRDECTSPLKDAEHGDMPDAVRSGLIVATVADELHAMTHRISDLNNVMAELVPLIEEAPAIAVAKLSEQFATLKFALTVTVSQLPADTRALIAQSLDRLMSVYRAAATENDESGTTDPIVVKL
jgi:hypothetical protein